MTETAPGHPSTEAPEQRRIRVAVVYGGRSSEHGISAVSAGSVLGALDPQKYDVVTVGITRAGQWVLTDTDRGPLAISNGILPEVSAPQVSAPQVSAPQVSASGSPEPTDDTRLTTRGSSAAVRALSEVDVVFPVLHGRFGEDGTIQGLLEMADVAYVGAGVFASAAAMDKEFTKKLLRAEGIEVGRFAVLRRGDAVPPDLLDTLGLPVFVKPARAGSSVGITKVRTAGELPDALDDAFGHDDIVLVEAGVIGREVECGVLEWPDGTVRASVPAEIRLVRGHDWYDFEAKYLDDACEFDLPADLGPEVTAQVQELAVRAFRALDGAGLARVDFFIPAGGGAPIVNEVNTMPGFTPISMYPRMWAASGLPYPELLDVLIATARARPR
jgi:D-alanine-D-alanine ligase